MGLEFANNDVLMACSLDNVKEASKGNVVVSGCEVTAQSPAAMAVDVSAGEIVIGGSLVSVSSTSKSVNAADATYDRYDIISVGSDGTVDYVAGTPAANPYPPNLPADHILLAVIFVENNSTTVESADISDERVIDASVFQKKGMFLKYSNSGSETNFSTSWSDLDSVSFSAGELKENDIVVVETKARYVSGNESNVYFRLSADDGTTNSWNVSSGAEPNPAAVVTAKIFQNNNPNGVSDGAYTLSGFERGAAVTGGGVFRPTSGDDWIVGSWTLKLQAYADYGDEGFNWAWSVYVLRGE